MRQDPYLPAGWSQKKIDAHYGLGPEHEYDAELECVGRNEKLGIIEVEISYFFVGLNRNYQEHLDDNYITPHDFYNLVSEFELPYEEWKDKTDKEIFQYIYDNLIDWQC